MVLHRHAVFLSINKMPSNRDFYSCSTRLAINYLALSYFSTRFNIIRDTHSSQNGEGTSENVKLKILCRHKIAVLLSQNAVEFFSNFWLTFG